MSQLSIPTLECVLSTTETANPSPAYTGSQGYSRMGPQTNREVTHSGEAKDPAQSLLRLQDFDVKLCTPRNSAAFREIPPMANIPEKQGYYTGK